MKPPMKPMAAEIDLAPDVAENLLQVKAKIAAQARAAGRSPDAVSLVGVTKFHGPERIRPALLAGHRHFGENRVADAEAKWPALRAEFPDVRLHLIGPLQRNKVRRAVQVFDAIETVDRLRLAKALADEMKATGRRLDCFVQVNIGEEPQKAGCPPAETDGLVQACRDELGLSVVGLMCIPPVNEEPSPYFALLAKIAARNGLKDLSMGMSSDYETAVRFGATIVRVGSAIFGARPTFTPAADSN